MGQTIGLLVSAAPKLLPPSPHSAAFSLFARPGQEAGSSHRLDSTFDSTGREVLGTTKPTAGSARRAGQARERREGAMAPERFHRRRGTLPATNMEADRGPLQKEIDLPGTSPWVPR